MPALKRSPLFPAGVTRGTCHHPVSCQTMYKQVSLVEKPLELLPVDVTCLPPGMFLAGEALGTRVPTVAKGHGPGLQGSQREKEDSPTLAPPLAQHPRDTTFCQQRHDPILRPKSQLPGISWSTQFSVPSLPAHDHESTLLLTRRWCCYQV